MALCAWRETTAKTNTTQGPGLRLIFNGARVLSKFNTGRTIRPFHLKRAFMATFTGQREPPRFRLHTILQRASSPDADATTAAFPESASASYISA